MNLNKNIGENLRKLRQTKGLSQEYIAFQLEISANAYGKMERNQTDISLSKLLRILEVLEIKPSEFFKMIENKNNFNSSKNILTDELIQFNGSFEKSFESLIQEISKHEYKISEILLRIEKLENHQK